MVGYGIGRIVSLKEGEARGMKMATAIISVTMEMTYGEEWTEEFFDEVDMATNSPTITEVIRDRYLKENP